MRRKQGLVLLFTGLLAVRSWGAEPPSPDLTELRDRVRQQEEQIKKLTEAVEQQRKLLDHALTSNTGSVAPAATSAPAVANAPASTAAPAAVPVANTSDSSVPVVPAVNVARPRWLTNARGQNTQGTGPSKISIPIGNTTFTPVGFVDFTWFGRTTNTGSGLGTNFGGIPYNNVAAGHLSENNFSAQNSRLGLRIDSRVFGAKVMGYFEGDFYGNQPANVFVSNNADTFRLRLFWIDLQKGKWEILGGQSWSMFTPNRKGLSPIPADIFYTQNMDLNYQAGLIWARQAQFRLIYHPTKDWAAGISLENPQQYIGGSAGTSGTSVVLPKTLASVLTPQFNNAASANGTTTGGGNYSTPNLHPDIIFKGAYDGHVGPKDQIFHVEAGALIRSFKATIPVGTPVNYQSNSATSVSGSVNANLEVVKNVKLIANTFFGQGGGRYIFGLAPDVIVRANGTISPIHSYSTVDGVEVNVGKKTLVDAYYGGVYIGRQLALDTDRSQIGYGFAGSPIADNKTIQEFTFGITQTFWKSENLGALALITQYSYLMRDPWAFNPPAPKSTHTNMYYIDLRYTLP